MAKKPRPLKQPILSTPQWVRVAFLGITTAIITVSFEAYFEDDGFALAATMGFVAFALLSMAAGLSARSETRTAFNRDILRNRQQLMLYGVAVLFTILPTILEPLQNLLGFTSLDGRHWLWALAAAFALLLVDEVIKIFLRRTAADVGESTHVDR
jgi:Ca2+-transporting ATPase